MGLMEDIWNGGCCLELMIVLGRSSFHFDWGRVTFFCNFNEPLLFNITPNRWCSAEQARITAIMRGCIESTGDEVSD